MYSLHYAGNNLWIGKALISSFAFNGSNKHTCVKQTANYLLQYANKPKYSVPFMSFIIPKCCLNYSELSISSVAVQPRIA
jgi:hypothetical protein